MQRRWCAKPVDHGRPPNEALQIPRLAFINKMDRTGANPYRVVEQLRDKLGAEAFMMQIPIGAEDNFKGVIDLIEMVSLHARR